MEVTPSLVVITFSLLFLLNCLAKYYKAKHGYKLPPGPKKLPLIGNLHQLAMTGKLPHHALRELSHKYGPLMHLQLGQISTVIVSSPKMAKEVMKTHDASFSNRPKLLSPDIMAYNSSDIIFSPTGDYWRQMRKICVLELLSTKRVQSFSYIREDETKKLIQSIKSSAGSTINLTNKIFALVSASVSRAAFGGKAEDHDAFVSLMTEAIALTGGFELADMFPSVKPIHILTGMKSKYLKIHKRADKILESIVKKHQEKRATRIEGNNSTEAEQEDLVDVLLRVQQSGSLEVQITNNNIKAIIWDVFGAGTDSSATTIEWAMSEMMKNPQVMKKAQGEIREALKGKERICESDIEELSYLNSVVKETMRLYPPAPLLIPRECTELTNIDGYDIPIKSKVMINAWAIGRDPEYWNDAEKFIPERFENSLVDFKGNHFEFVPFGAGRRICPGISFGLAGVMFPLAMLLYHFDWELPNKMKPQDLDMIEHFGMAVGRKNALSLIPTLYHI